MNNSQIIYYLYFRNIEIDDLSPIKFYVENGVITRIVYIYTVMMYKKLSELHHKRHYKPHIYRLAVNLSRLPSGRTFY